LQFCRPLKGITTPRHWLLTKDNEGATVLQFKRSPICKERKFAILRLLVSKKQSAS
jgi:hypothetical protein